MGTKKDALLLGAKATPAATADPVDAAAEKAQLLRAEADGAVALEDEERIGKEGKAAQVAAEAANVAAKKEIEDEMNAETEDNQGAYIAEFANDAADMEEHLVQNAEHNEEQAAIQTRMANEALQAGHQYQAAAAAAAGQKRAEAAVEYEAE